jgi:hypothetical protein
MKQIHFPKPSTHSDRQEKAHLPPKGSSLSQQEPTTIHLPNSFPYTHIDMCLNKPSSTTSVPSRHLSRSSFQNFSSITSYFPFEFPKLQFHQVILPVRVSKTSVPSRHLSRSSFQNFSFVCIPQKAHAC